MSPSCEYEIEDCRPSVRFRTGNALQCRIGVDRIVDCLLILDLVRNPVAAVEPDRTESHLVRSFDREYAAGIILRKIVEGCERTSRGRPHDEVELVAGRRQGLLPGKAAGQLGYAVAHMIDAEIGEAVLDQARIGIGRVEIAHVRVDAERVDETTGGNCRHRLQVVRHNPSRSASACAQRKVERARIRCVDPLSGPIVAARSDRRDLRGPAQMGP